MRFEEQSSGRLVILLHLVNKINLIEQCAFASGLEVRWGAHVRSADPRDTGYPVEQGLEQELPPHHWHQRRKWL